MSKKEWLGWILMGLGIVVIVAIQVVSVIWMPDLTNAQVFRKFFWVETFGLASALLGWHFVKV